MNTNTNRPIVPTVPASRQQLRTLIRQRRQQLSVDAQQQAAVALATKVSTSAVIQHSQHIALYLANDGELDTTGLIQALWQQNKHVYLPVLHPFTAGYLLFVRYCHTTALKLNRFGIAEPLPACPDIIPLQQLDVIFTPLVAFDHAGNRLGMGGGFYDRTLSQLPCNNHVHIIGLAHDCQLVDAVPKEAWDIPLQQIITPSKHWTFNPGY